MGLPVPAPFAKRSRTHLWVTFQREGRTVGRCVTANGRVRWGPAVGIEFSYPVPDLDRTEELFAPGRGAARLRLLEGMTGELAVGDDRLALEHLEDWGLVRARRGRRWVQLTPQMEGWLEYRGLTVSFTHGSAPLREEAPRLGKVPNRFRRKMLAREEWPFALLTWALYGLLLYLASILGSIPLPDAPQPERVAKRFAKLIYEAPPKPSRARTEVLREPGPEGPGGPEEEAKPPGEAGPEVAEPEPGPSVPEAEPEAQPGPEVAEAPPEPEPGQPEAAETQPAGPAPSPGPEVADSPPPLGDGGTGLEPEPRATIPTREEIRQRVANKGLLGLLGGRGTASTARPVASILEGKGAAEDLDRVLERVEGLRTASGGEGGAGFGSGAPGVPGGVPGGTGSIDDAARRVASASGGGGRLKGRGDHVVGGGGGGGGGGGLGGEELDELNLKEAIAAIHRTVASYLGGIRYLYNRELRKDPELEGKMNVSITISPEGKVLECEVVDSDLGSPSLEKAVLARIRKWKFPPVVSRPITVTYPFLFFPSM